MTATPSARLQATARINRPDRKPLARRRARAVATAVAVLLLAAAGPPRAQTVSFSVARPSPGQFGFAELWNVALHNSSTDTQAVYFHVEASAADKGKRGTLPLFL